MSTAYSKELEKEKRELDELFGALQGAVEGSEALNKAKKKLIDSYGAYLSGLIDERGKVVDLEAAYRRLAEAIKIANQERGIKNAREAVENVYSDQMESLSSQLMASLESYGASTQEAARLTQRIVTSMAMGVNVDDDTVARINELSRNTPSADGGGLLAHLAPGSQNSTIWGWAVDQVPQPAELVNQMYSAQAVRSESLAEIDRTARLNRPLRDLADNMLDSFISYAEKAVENGGGTVIKVLDALAGTVEMVDVNLDDARNLLEEYRTEKAYRDGSTHPTEQPTIDADGGGGYTSQKLAEKDARKAALEAKRELAKQDRAYKAAMERAKGEYEAAMADNVIAYATGGRTYEDYIAEKERLDLKYVQDRLDIYNSLYENETEENKALLLKYDEDYQALLLKKAEMEKKFADARAKSNIDRLQREMKAEQDALELSFNNPDSNLYGDTLSQQEAIHQLKIKYLTRFRDQYNVGSKEYLQYERQLEDENAADILAKRKAYIAKLEEWRKDYSYLTLSKRRDMEIKVLDELYSRGIVREEEYQRILAQIRKKYSSEALTSEDGKIDYRSSSDQIQEKRGSEAAEKDKEFARIQALYEQGELSEEQYHQARRNVAKHYADLMYEDIRSILDEQTRMLFDLGTAWQNMFAGIAETGKISFEDIGSVAQTTFAVMSAGLEMYGQFAAAQYRIEIANMERRYDKEIESAQGNSYKVAKLEKKKEADMAKLKKEATRKEFNIKVISAVAQMAQNVISAYGAGWQLGPAGVWAAPLFAGLATANGLVQIALLKKQQQAAEAEGYAEGGFTRKGGKYEPAGIVHAGEWVASQKLLANPVARPLIEALDYAQRTNTLGSLKSEDVSRAITAPVSIAQMSENGPSTAMLAAAVMQTSSVVKDLTDRLNEPFVTINTVTGDYGIKKAQDEYSQLINNITPKRKRK